MTAFTLTVESGELARVMTNALAFFPARTMVTTALLEFEFTPDGVTITGTGTDTYTVGRDWCEARDARHDHPEPSFSIPVELDRSGWSDIEANARKDKGKTGRLEYRPNDALVFIPGGDKAERGVARDVTGEQTTHLVSGDQLTSRDVWSLCDELLTRLESVEPESPDVIAFDPALLGRFNKVKTPAGWDGERVLDLVFQGQCEPMLAKVGPSFVGAIMPIDRAVYVEKQGDAGQEGLW